MFMNPLRQLLGECSEQNFDIRYLNGNLKELVRSRDYFDETGIVQITLSRGGTIFPEKKMMSVAHHDYTLDEIENIKAVARQINYWFVLDSKGLQ